MTKWLYNLIIQINILAILFIPVIVESAELYRRDSTGEIWRYTGTPCTGGSCRGWVMLGNSPRIRAIEAISNELYRLHINGEVSQFTGVPCTGDSCPGWITLSNNPLTMNITAALHPANECSATARPPFTLVSRPTPGSGATNSGRLNAHSRAEFIDDRRYDSSVGFTHFNAEPRATVAV